MVTGSIGPRGMSPTTKIVLFNFWEYLTFVADSLVFLLIGLDVHLAANSLRHKADWSSTLSRYSYACKELCGQICSATGLYLKKFTKN